MYFEKSELRHYLVQLIIQSSLPLRTVEKSVAMDSTGFSTSLFGRWFDFRYGKLQSGDKRKWIKAHLMCGVLTNIVTAVEVTDGNAGDAPYFEPLLITPKQNYRAREVIGDKAYSSLANFKHADSKGVLAVIPFNANANAVHGTGDPLWTRLYHFYSLNDGWFERRYHQRSNIENTNAMIKMKFGERIRSRTKVAQFNELLCKVLCHNICVPTKSGVRIARTRQTNGSLKSRMRRVPGEIENIGLEVICDIKSVIGITEIERFPRSIQVAHLIAPLRELRCHRSVTRVSSESVGIKQPKIDSRLFTIPTFIVMMRAL